MAEVNSVQGAKIVAGKKLMPADSHGRQRVLIATLAATHAAYAIDDTIFLGRVPANSRFLLGGVIGVVDAGTTSSTLNIGIRNTQTGEVIDADGIAAGVDIASAAVVKCDTGELVANGSVYVTPAEVDVYATVKGAVLKIDQKMKFQIPYVTD